MEFLDTVKSASYLFFGMLIGYYFWEFCEYRIRKDISISSINPIWYLIMVVWGASGFFFLPYTQHSVFHLLYYPVPDWNIQFFLWTKWEFLQHCSWLFSSVILPLTLLGISLLMHRISQRHSSLICRLFNYLFNCLRDISIGLSIGVSTHLIGDFVLQWTPSIDTNINIFGWLQLHSLIWLCLNLFLGFIIPFIVISKLSLNS